MNQPRSTTIHPVVDKTVVKSEQVCPECQAPNCQLINREGKEGNPRNDHLREHPRASGGGGICFGTSL
jgi:hypothetical protein